MAITELFSNLLNPILSPLLFLPPWAVILTISFVVALFSTLAYKYFTDQNLMRSLKAELKELQAEVKELKEQPQEAMKVQGKMMETNMKFMMQSLKPMFITFIPLILILAWLPGHVAYHPLEPDTPFTTSVLVEEQLIGMQASLIAPDTFTILSEQNQTINGELVNWRLQGPQGEYELTYVIGENTYTKEVIITSKAGEYAPVEEQIKQDGIKAIMLGNERIQILPTPFWNGWLASYIIFSIALSLILRKVFRVV